MSYNIPRFHISHYDLRKFDGPKAGEIAPDFEAVDLEGKPQRLSDFRGQWVVLESASVTCSMYSRNVDAMQALAAEYPDTAFLVLYVREAHPGERLAQHESMEEKVDAAKHLKPAFNENRQVLVDNFSGEIHQQYGLLPNFVYLISPEGKVHYRCNWTHMQGIENALRNRDQINTDDYATMDDLSGRSLPHSIKTMYIGGWLALWDFFRSLPKMLKEHKIIDQEHLDQKEKRTANS